jgi:hypothetical protein
MLAVLARSVHIALCNQTRDGQQQVEDHYCEGVPVAEQEVQYIIPWLFGIGCLAPGVHVALCNQTGDGRQQEPVDDNYCEGVPVAEPK